MASVERGMGGASDDAVGFAYRSLRRDVLDGTIPPGTVLSQVNLARSLRISRTPLREALRQLASEGLVAGDFNRRLHVTSLDLDDFDQIYALRISIEPQAIRSTVPRLDAIEKSRLTSDVGRMDIALRNADMSQFRANHRAFHLGLAAHAGARVEKLIADLWDHSERYRLQYMHADFDSLGSASAERLAVSQTEHRELLDSALSGNSEACARLLVSHLSRTLESVLSEQSDKRHPRLSQFVTETAGASHPGRN